MKSVANSSADRVPQANRAAAVELLLLMRERAAPPPSALFPALLNALCVCGYGISSAGLRHGQIELALDDHAFTLALCDQTPHTAAAAGETCDAQPWAAYRPGTHDADTPTIPCRPDLPGAWRGAASLGLTFVRHRQCFRLTAGATMPDQVFAAFLETLLRHLTPDGVLMPDPCLILTTEETLRLPFSQLRRLARGPALPLPQSRHPRPEPLHPLRRKSVFARADPVRAETTTPPAAQHHAITPAFSRTQTDHPSSSADLELPLRLARPDRDRVVIPAPMQTPRAPSAARHRAPAISAPLAETVTRAPSRSCAPRPGPDHLPFADVRAAPRRAPAAATLHAWRAKLVVSRASGLCDGLALAWQNGEQRVVATHLFTATALFGLSMFMACSGAPLTDGIVALL